MKKNIIYAVTCAVLSVLTFTSCDEHEHIDTSIKMGYVLCDDHRVMSLSAYQSQSESKAVGVIFTPASEVTPALAVSLEEIPAVQFCSILGYEQGTSGSLTAFDGFRNTTSLQNTIDISKGLGSPMADLVFRSGKYGQSTFVPSVAEFRLLISGLPVVNPVIEALGGKPINTSPAGGGCWYWSSTEVAQNMSKQAWLVSTAAGGSYEETPKDDYHPVRTVIAVY